MMHAHHHRSDQREPNGRWPLRPCPDDFEAVFIEIGRHACEEHFRTGRKTITRWIEECGLVKKRAKFVRDFVVILRRLPNSVRKGLTANLTHDELMRLGSGK